MAFQPPHSSHMPLTFRHPQKHEYPHWTKEKARNFGYKWLLKAVTDWQVGFSHPQVLPGWVRFAPTAFINVSMNTIFMHWISKANSQLIMQNNPEVFHGSQVSQELNFPSPFGLWWTWPFTSSKELWAARLKLVMRASFAFQAVREPFLNTPR